MGTHPIFESDFDCLTDADRMDTFSSVEYDQRVNQHHQQLDYGVETNDSALFDNIINSYEKADNELGEQSFANFNEQAKEQEMHAMVPIEVNGGSGGGAIQGGEDHMGIKRTIDYLKGGPESPSASTYVKQETVTDSPPSTSWMSGLQGDGDEGGPVGSNSYHCDERNSSHDLDTSEKFVSNIIKKEPMDMSDIIHKRSKRGRKRKTTESDVDCGKLDRISDDYRRKRERNNIAVRKSRDKAKMRQQERESQLMNLSQENSALKDAVKRRNQDLERVKADYDKLKSYVHSLPANLVPSWMN